MVNVWSLKVAKPVPNQYTPPLLKPVSSIIYIAPRGMVSYGMCGERRLIPDMMYLIDDPSTLFFIFSNSQEPCMFHTNREDSNQPARLCRLIRVFPVRAGLYEIFSCNNSFN